MSNTLADITRIQDLSNKFLNSIRPKCDQYHNATLKRDLTKNQFGRVLNEHQQRYIDDANRFITDLASEIDSEAKVFTSSFNRILKSIDVTDLGLIQAKLFKDIQTSIDGVMRSDVNKLDIDLQALCSDINALVDQIRKDSEREPRVFAKKPTPPEDAMKVDRESLDMLVSILGMVKKSAALFETYTSSVTSDRILTFLKIENQRSEILKSAIPVIVHLEQYLSSDKIDPDKVREDLNELTDILKTAYRQIVMEIGSDSTQFKKHFDISYIMPAVMLLDKTVVNNRRDATQLKMRIGTIRAAIESRLNNKITDANKIENPALEKIVSDNADRIAVISNDIRSFITQYDSIVQMLPKALYGSVVSTLNSVPSVENKKSDKIWQDYQIWYDKLEDQLLDLIDFTKMYMGIKMLYPFTIALRTVDQKGKDTDNQAYVRAMQTLLNEALDGPKMPSSKKNLVAKLYKFYPADRNVALAYHRINVNV